MVWDIIFPNSSFWCYWLRFRLFWFSNTILNAFHCPYFDTTEVEILIWSTLNLEEFAFDSILHLRPVSLLSIFDSAK